MNSQGFTGLPLGVAWSPHRDAYRHVVTGFRGALSKVSPIGLPSNQDFTPRRVRPRGIHLGRLVSCPLRAVPVFRLGMTLKHRSRVVAARSPQVQPQYGARATAEHQCSNRIISRWFESASRATEAPSVGAFREPASRRVPRRVPRLFARKRELNHQAQYSRYSIAPAGRCGHHRDARQTSSGESAG